MIQHGLEITSHKYYDGEVIATVTDIEQQQFTDRQYLLRDIIEGLEVITNNQTSRLVIEIQVDKRGRYKLTQRWRVE